MTIMMLANSEGKPGAEIAVKALQEGRPALDAIEMAIRAVEVDPSIRTVGRGGFPNILGKVECDAAIMNGRTMEAGAVGALQGFLYPISIARQVMERLPHVFLVGEGAARFAREIGAEQGELLTEQARKDWERWLAQHVPAEKRASLQEGALTQYVWPARDPVATYGTTTYFAKDKKGDLAVGVSTSGWSFKYPGRLGDSPVIGAGLYVDNRYGAAACTFTGEMTVRAGTARAIILYMKKGASVEDACAEAVEDLKMLKGGFLGTVVIHACDKVGHSCVTSFNAPKEVGYYHWSDGMKAAEFGEAKAVS